MPLTHISHPEDCILTGDLSVLNLLYDQAYITMKMDGMSLVWGTNPANGRFFVCTKSAFNKKKVRLCYTSDDIDTHFGHQEEVAEILYYCLKYLPKTDNIYWGDWLGFGRTDVLTQNTLTYVFSDVISQQLVIAPHTQVYVEDKMCDAVCVPLEEVFVDTDMIKWVQPSVDRIYRGQSTPKVNPNFINFLTKKEAEEAKICINSIIKAGYDLDDGTLTDILGCQHLANLYQMVIEIKEDLMEDFIVSDSPMCYLPNGDMTSGEGFVFHSETYGSVKLVNRHEFAYANFNSGRYSS